MAVTGAVSVGAALGGVVAGLMPVRMILTVAAVAALSGDFAAAPRDLSGPMERLIERPSRLSRGGLRTTPAVLLSGT